MTLLVSPFRTDPDDPFLRHKTSVRGFYNREHRRALHEGHFDALFVNRLDHVTEGAITNVFARFGEEWVTPPLTDGLLPGIWRAWFLAEKGAEERSLTLEDLLGRRRDRGGQLSARRGAGERLGGRSVGVLAGRGLCRRRAGCYSDPMFESSS